MKAKLKEWFVTFLSYLGAPLALLLCPVMIKFGWYFRKGLNGFEIIERIAVFAIACGLATLLLLAGLLCFLACH